MNITPSMINTYMTCPAKAKYAYIDKLTRPPGASLIVGRAFDEAVSHFWQARLAGQRPPDCREVYVETLRAESEPVELSPEDKSFIEGAIDNGARAVSAYIETVGPRVVPGGVQVPRSLRAGQHTVYGRADLIGATPKSIKVTPRCILVADVKTSRRKTDYIRSDELVQLVSYATRDTATPTIEYPIVQIHRAVITANPTVSIITHRLEPQDAKYVESLAAHVARSFEAGAFPPNRESFVCSRRFCPFWKTCEEEYGGKVRE